MDKVELRAKITAWIKHRHITLTAVNWQFFQTKAQSKMERHDQNVKKVI
jgi:hypothetical protein